MRLCDQELLKLLAEDLQRHFDRLVGEYYQKVFVFLLYKMRHRQDAEDMSQETFVHAYRWLAAASSLEIRALSLRPWLFKIAYNCAMNYLNREGKRSSLCVSIDCSEERELLESSAYGQYTSPEQAVEARETAFHLYECVQQNHMKNNGHHVEIQEELRSSAQNRAGQTQSVQGPDTPDWVIVRGRDMALAYETVAEMDFKTLVERSLAEMGKYRHKEASDDQYCLEIFHRAVVLRNDDAWSFLQRQFAEHVHIWLRRHPGRDSALRYDSEQSYIDEAFRRFWQAVNEQRLTFTTLAGALRYLHLCLNCAIMDVLRAFTRPREEFLSDYGQLDKGEPLVEDAYQENELWDIIEALLPGEKEKRIAYLHFHCNLKPREIMRYCPGEFSDEREIYRLKRNVMDRILRNIDMIRWRLCSDGE